MQEDNFHVDVLAVLVQEVLEEVRDWFVGDVAAHDNMSANTTNELDSTPAQSTDGRKKKRDREKKREEKWEKKRETYKQLPCTRSM